jgi:virginiamycin B lyase
VTSGQRSIRVIGVATLAACAAAQVACAGETGPAPTTPKTATTASTETGQALAEQDVVDAGATALARAGDWLSAGAGAVWISNPPSHELHRLDADSGGLVATVALDELPCAATDFGFGALWTLTCDEPGLTKIDAAQNRVTGRVALPVGAVSEGGEASIGAGEGAVWVVLRGSGCRSCILGRIDPRTLRVVARIRVREGAAAVRAGEGAVWVTNPARSLVQKIDPGRTRVVATARVGPQPRFLAAGEGAVWTLNQGDGSVTRLDPASGEVAATIPAEVTGEGGDITTGAGSVWVRGSGYLLTRIDPDTNSVVARYGPASGSGAVVVAFGAVWISAHDVGTVWRLPLQRR